MATIEEQTRLISRPMGQEGAYSANESERIKQQIDDLKSAASRAKVATYTIVISACAAIVILLVQIFVFKRDPSNNLLAIFGVICGATISYVIAHGTRPYAEELAELDQQLHLLEDTTEERRAERLFKLHQLDLKQYYSQTLRQANVIFVVGLFCLFSGVLIVVGVLVLIYRAQNSDLVHQILLASTGVVSGFLTNFVGSIFLKMYTETIRSLTAFHNRLVTTHHMHYGALLAAKIADKKLLYETFSKMAIGTIMRPVEKEGKAAEKEEKNEAALEKHRKEDDAKGKNDPTAQEQ